MNLNPINISLSRNPTMNSLTIISPTTPALAIIISVDLIAAAGKSESGFFARKTKRVITAAFARYQKWLALMSRYPSTRVSPARDIDEMWHLHMLHPVAYHRDCLVNFGDIIDHDGGFGATPDEAPILLEIFQETSALWEKEYGEPYTDTGSRAVKCTRNCVSRCKRACKPT